MPWSVADVERHHAGLTLEQRQLWVNTANRILRDCQRRRTPPSGGCEALAIRLASSVVNRGQAEG